MYPRSLRSYCQILRLWYQSVSINTSVKRHSVKPTLQNFSLDKQKEKCNNFFPFFLFFPLLLSFFFSFLGGETPTQGCSWYISNEHGLSMASSLQKHLIEFVFVETIQLVSSNPNASLARQICGQLSSIAT